jgi:hypothetical protein
MERAKNRRRPLAGTNTFHVVVVEGERSRAMLEAHQVEELITSVCSMDRAAIKMRFLTFRADFPVDFTPEFLDSLSVERLRHIYVALCLQTQKIPGGTGAVTNAA